MALLASICVGLLLLMVTTLITPAVVRAANAPRDTPGRATAGPANPPPPTAERQREPGWVPGVGQASSPYDRQALRNFDAGSHR